MSGTFNFAKKVESRAVRPLKGPEGRFTLANERGADLESRVERRVRIWGTAIRGPEKKWDAEGFWAGGLDLVSGV